MKHEFTDTQLRQAVADYLEDAEVDLSISALGDFFWTQQVKALRKMLDALPEPQDDWQECGANDLQSGDVYLAESPDANIAYKKPIEKCAIVGDWLEVQHVGGMKSSAKISANTFYRIPAPVQHPDPEQYPVIIVRETIVGPLDEPTPMIHDGGNYYESPTGTYGIKTITDWSPAKVVADDDC